MIKYKKQNYDDIREPISDEVFVNLLRETLKVNNIEVDEDTSRRVFVSLLTSMSFYLYNHPEFFIDLKKMVIYRDTNLSNLLVLEAKSDENANSIMSYYKNGGAYSEQLEVLVKEFIQGVLKHSQAKEKEVLEDIQKIEQAKRSKERE